MRDEGLGMRDKSLTPDVNPAGEDARVPTAFPKGEGNSLEGEIRDERLEMRDEAHAPWPPLP